MNSFAFSPFFPLCSWPQVLLIKVPYGAEVQPATTRQDSQELHHHHPEPGLHLSTPPPVFPGWPSFASGTGCRRQWTGPSGQQSSPKVLQESLNAVTLHLTPARLPHTFQDKRGFISQPFSRGRGMTPGRAAQQASKQPELRPEPVISRAWVYTR